MTWQGGFSNPTVGPAQIQDGAVTSLKLADGAVVEAKLADLAVAAGKLQDEAVQNAKLGNDSVSTAKVQDLAIVTAKIGLLAVGSAQIDEVSATKISAGTIDTGTITVNSLLKMAAGADIQFVRNSAATISTNDNPQNGDTWIEYRGNDAGAIIGLRKSSGVELVAAQMNVTANGFEINQGMFLLEAHNTVAVLDLAWGVDTDTGLYRHGSNSIGFVTGGSIAMQLGTTNLNFGGDSGGATGHASIAHDSTGSQTAPVYTFVGDPDTGMYLGGTNTLRFTSAGTYSMDITSSALTLPNDAQVIEFTGSAGPVGITFLGEGRLYYRSNPNTLTFEDGSATQIFGFDYDNGHGWMESPQTTTNSGLAAWRHNNFAGSGGTMYDFMPLISTEKMKENIRDLTVQKARHYLRMYQPREWHSKASGDPKRVWLPGFVVEESPKVPRDLIAPLVALVKELDERVKTLETAA